jgi:hypothetical protein
MESRSRKTGENYIVAGNSKIKRIVPPFWPVVEAILLHSGHSFKSFVQLKSGKRPNRGSNTEFQAYPGPNRFHVQIRKSLLTILCFAVVQFQVLPVASAD